ncbi:MAG: (2Fe-2S) ferredoxin domain-containing protein [Clostridiales bacterium]|nr:(2Fe-2S) ferredoxin domain-containing protein [Clostridiales bacterium]
MKTLKELAEIRERMQNKINIRREDGVEYRVVVGMATCGIAAGARPVLTALVDEINRRHLTNVIVSQTGCIGVCRLEPVVEVYGASGEKVTYVNMTDEKARKIVSEHIVNNRVVTEYTIGANE